MNYKMKSNEITITILKSLQDCDILRSGRTLEEIIMDKRQKILKEHLNHHSIWQSQTNGRWCTKLGADKHLIVRKERESLENAIIEFYITEQRLNLTIQEVFEDWQEYESSHNEHAMKTINEYSIDYRRFIMNDVFSALPINTVTDKDVVSLVKRIIYDGEKVPLKRFKSFKTVLRTLFNHARLHMDIDCISVKNILDDIKFPSSAFKESNNSDATQVFKHSEVCTLQKRLKGSDNLLELGILLTISTGLRVGELCTLKREDFSGICLHIRRSEHKAKFEDGYRYYIGTPKKDKMRNVILNEETQAICEQILASHDSEWFFPNDTDMNDHLHAYHFDRRIRRICREIDIPVRSMHKLRKTYASILLTQGVDEKLVQAQLGHADISTTHNAYHYNIFDQEESNNILRQIKIG